MADEERIGTPQPAAVAEAGLRADRRSPAGSEHAPADRRLRRHGAGDSPGGGAMVFEREKVKIHILLVDDDARLQTNVRDFLEPYGCRITSLRSGEGVEAAVKEQKPDIVLLDVMLPDDDGFVVLRRLRGVSDLPVIMLTARGNDADRIVGLEMGADDYLPKPFNPRELLARIKAVLRRASAQPDAATQEPPRDMLVVGSIRLDLKRQRLERGDQSVQLTTTEFRIIRAFMGRPDEVLSRDQIQTLAFGENYYCNDRNIDVYVSRARTILRKLCEESPIHTVWGAGYRWVSDEGENLPR